MPSRLAKVGSLNTGSISWSTHDPPLLSNRRIVCEPAANAPVVYDRVAPLIRVLNVTVWLPVVVSMLLTRTAKPTPDALSLVTADQITPAFSTVLSTPSTV